MDKIAITLALAAASLRSEFQYRANAISSVIGGMLYQLTGFLVVFIIVDRFNSIGGWSLSEITFLYGMRLTSHGIFYLCFSQLFDLDRVLISGEFDRFLVRPIHPLLQIFTRKLRVNCFGDLIGGVALLIAAAPRVAIDWGPLTIGFLILAVIGGALVEGSVQITLSSLSFRFLNALAVRTTANEIFNQYGNYPQRIFPTALQYALTFVLPVAFVAWFPASALLDRTGGLIVPGWLAWLAPLVGLGAFLAALRIWHRASRGYQSSGT
jgi:ABC-2 type transport system permease protein